MMGLNISLPLFFIALIWSTQGAYYPSHSMLRLDATQKKRWIGFDFRFKKNSIKQATFISDIFPSRVEAAKQKKI